MSSTSVGASRAARRSISSRVQTVALGLWGELRISARVRGVSAAERAAKSGRKVRGVRGTLTTLAPASSMLGT